MGFSVSIFCAEHAPLSDSAMGRTFNTGSPRITMGFQPILSRHNGFPGEWRVFARALSTFPARLSVTNVAALRDKKGVQKGGSPFAEPLTLISFISRGITKEY